LIISRPEGISTTFLWEGMNWGKSLSIKVNPHSTVASHLVNALVLVRFCELIGSLLVANRSDCLLGSSVVISLGLTLVLWWHKYVVSKLAEA
jgi:hypothetical protein